MKKLIIQFSIALLLMTVAILMLSTITSCSNIKKRKVKTEDIKNEFHQKGTFGYDKVFLQTHYKNTVVLESKDGESSVILSPELQGRVMTSTLNGNEGMSFGWLNYDLIESKKIKEHFNPTGGEERFWLGPEGGQFSIYFEKDKPFEFDNWYVPTAIDTEAFNILEQNDTEVMFYKKMDLTNYSGSKFNIEVRRKVSLLTKQQIVEILNLPDDNFNVVAYETQNKVKNIGKEEWNEESGLLSIWLLSMMTPSNEVTVIAPIVQGSEEEKGIRVNDNYFGKIDSNRLKSTDQHVFFKADGKSRGKIGITPLRATECIGSYDAENKVLTILQITLPKASDKYVNSAWELQEDPYSGDVLNSYNDGPLEDGTQMGPFYELESSSPALALKPGESYNHIQKIYHIKGSKEVLNQISKQLLKVSIDKIETVF